MQNIRPSKLRLLSANTVLPPALLSSENTPDHIGAYASGNNTGFHILASLERINST